MDKISAKKRLDALYAKKQKERLSDEEFQEFQELKKIVSRSKGSRGKEKGAGKLGNDPSWWKKYPELMDNAANLPSNWIAGTPLDKVNLPITIPGVAVIEYVPTYGVANLATDPLNVWSRDLYLRMFQKWRGISAYSASDLGITLIATLEAIRMIIKLERIYGVINRYSRINVNMPFAEVEALGLTQTQADWIRDHLSDYRYDLNVLIMKAQRLCLPNDMSLLEDQISLLNFEYLDHETGKSQIIIFDSSVFGIYEETKLSTGGCIHMEHITMNTTAPLIDTSGTYDNMFVALNNRLNALLGSDSVQKIYGDLVTWFGDEQMVKFSALSDDYIIVPVYADSMLHKMHNIDPIHYTFLANCVPSGMTAADKTAMATMIIGDYRDYVIFQYNDAIWSRVCACDYSGSGDFYPIANSPAVEFFGTTNTGNTYLGDQPTVLDTYHEVADADHIIEGSLFKNVSKAVTDTANAHFGKVFESIAFELIYSIKLVTITASGLVSTVTQSNCQNSSSAANNAGHLAVLDWAPIVYQYVQATGKTVDAFGDLDTALPIYPNAKIRLNEATVYSGLRTDVKIIAK